MQPQYIPISPKAKDIAGQRFNRWLVLSCAGKTKTGQLRWLCRCDCGTERVVAGLSLRNGVSRSCGCHRKEQTQKRNHKHGLARHPLYQAWSQMIMRCTNPNNTHYESYGGRGIHVFDDWLHSFPNFLNYVSTLPNFGKPRYTLDRIDNDGDYAPDNVRWATQTEQAYNKRKTIHLTLDGVTLPIGVWADRLGITSGALRQRKQAGWSDERILTTPIAQDPGKISSRLTVSAHTENTTTQDQPAPSA